MHFTMSTRLLLVLMLLGGGCSRKSFQPMVYLKCDDKSDLVDKIDLTVFGEFKPGMRLRQAIFLFGEPKHVWRGSNGTVYHVYPSPKADVAVAKETQVSGSVPRLEWWAVYAFPSGTNAFSLTALLSSDVQNETEKHTPPYMLVISDSDPDERVFCKVTTDGITEIRWMNGQSTLPP